MSPSNPNPFDLTGKVAVVTGCRRGIGTASSYVHGTIIAVDGGWLAR